MIFLVEIDGYDKAAGVLRTERFGSKGYTTAPGDVPPNATFRARLADPGNYKRHMFGEGRTSGESDVGAGEVVLTDPDGRLDYLVDLAVDGRGLRIFGLPNARSPWSARQTVLVGTMDQVVSAGREKSIRIRDRLELLREPIQPLTYLGTTINGGLTIAEGKADLKDVRKPKGFGRFRNAEAVPVDPYDHIWQAASNALTAITAVRDKGVALTATANYATLAALKAASLSPGQYATCLALGLFRMATRNQGTVTVDGIEGATLADRSAARIAQRMIAGIGTASAADFDALHAANPAECGIWIGPGEADILGCATAVLASIGGYLTCDRLGVYRTGRLVLPAGVAKMVLDEHVVIEKGEGLARLATADEGEGIPAGELTLRWGRNWTVQRQEELEDVDASAEILTFATQQWRQVKRESAAVQLAHLKHAKPTFDTLLCNEADAIAETERRLALYGERRDLFQVQVWSDKVTALDLGDVVSLRVRRYGLDVGKLFRVLGITPTLKPKITTLELWG